MTDLPAGLQDFLVEKLEALSLPSNEDTLEFVSGIVVEDTFEREDKESAVLSFLEADEDEDKKVAVTQLFDSADEWKAEQQRVEEEARLAKQREEEEAAAAQQRAKQALSPEEEEERRKQAIAAEYGLLEEETPEEAAARREAEQAPSAVLVDPKYLTRKGRKKAEKGVDLLAQPNLNAAIVRGAELQRRQEDAAKAAAKREKDKADLKKQKETAAAKAEERKKKAQKVERKR